MELKDKIVVITGSSKGLGKTLAIALIKSGAKVVINARANREIKTLAREIGAEYFAADVTKEKEMKALAKFALKKFGRIDIWINNAGIWTQRGPIEETDLKKVRAMMEVNLYGTIIGSLAALKIMRSQGAGAIVNIISRSATGGRPLSAGYTATKWAARGFTESLRIALEPHNIQVLAIHPGGIQTDLFGEHQPKDYANFMPPEFTAAMIVKHLQQNKPGHEVMIDRPDRNLPTAGLVPRQNE